MAKKAQDRRVTRTRANIRKSITRLLYEKPVNEITVREITEGADINRATFYLHYKDVYDLIHQIENEMFEEFQQIVNAHSPDEFRDRPLPVLENIFYFLQKNADMCTALLSPNGDINFVNKLKDVLWEKCASDWTQLYGHNLDEEDIDPYISFIVSGSMGLLTFWLDHNMDRTPEEIAKIAEQMIVQGLSALDILPETE